MHLLNAHGLDEAGIDGGGIFREFLNELLKSGFNPNQGLFKTTNEGLLYPNPAAQMLVGDAFARHYYFLGRMLGKVTYTRHECGSPMRVLTLCAPAWLLSASFRVSIQSCLRNFDGPLNSVFFYSYITCVHTLKITGVGEGGRTGGG